MSQHLVSACFCSRFIVSTSPPQSYLDPGGATLLANALMATFASLGRSIKPVVYLAQGFRRAAFATAQGQVFLVGLNAAAEVGLMREVGLLGALADELPVAVPRPRWQSARCEAFPFGVVGYPMLPGEVFEPRRHEAGPELAGDLGRLLFALHDLDAGRFVDMVPSELERSLVQRSRRLHREVLPKLRGPLSSRTYALLDAWFAELRDDSELFRFVPRLTHGDLWYGNILVDADTRLVGVIDFEEAHIGDPAADLAVQRHLGGEFAEQVLEAYAEAGGRVDEELRHRVQRRWELREWDGIAFALEEGDRESLTDALDKLERNLVATLVHGVEERGEVGE